eukprot:11373266-Prorocentrum_lima.AAC.1
MKFWLSRTDLARLLALARWAWGEITSACPTRLRLGSPPSPSGAGREGPGCGASPTRVPCRELWSRSRLGGEGWRPVVGRAG